MSQSYPPPYDVNAPTIVLSCSARGDEPTRRYEEALLNMLQFCAHRPILVIPHLYNLRPDHPAIERLRGIEAPIVLLSWLYPRAARWTLAALVGRPPANLAALNLSRFDSPVSCAALAETLLMSEGESPAEPNETVEFCLGDWSVEAKDEIGGGGELPARWYPVIDGDRCVNCRQCVDFCLFSVYSTEEDGRVIVSHSDGCKTGCPACSRICPTGAIIFPHYDCDPSIAGAVPHKAATAAGAGQSVADGAGGAIGGTTAGAAKSAAGKAAMAPLDDLDDLMDQLDELDRGKQ